MDKKSMRYVEKTALSIYDEGIETYAALEEYFEKKKKTKNSINNYLLWMIVIL
jgi:hypothetical protein